MNLIITATNKGEVPSESVERFLTELFQNIGYSDVRIKITGRFSPVVDVDPILRSLHSVLNVNLTDLSKRGKERFNAYARLIFANWCFKEKIPDKEIGRLLKRDRSTISFYKKEYDQKYGFDSDFRYYANKVNQILKENQ